MECHSLWIQQRLRRKEFELRKVPGEENPADLFTKHLESAKKLEQLLALFNCDFRSGRAAAAPNLKKAEAMVRLRPSDSLFAGLVLPHLASPAEREKKYPQIKAPPEHYGEEDVPPVEELGDPVPRLQRAAPRLRTVPKTPRPRPKLRGPRPQGWQPKRVVGPTRMAAAASLVTRTMRARRRLYGQGIICADYYVNFDATRSKYYP